MQNEDKLIPNEGQVQREAGRAEPPLSQRDKLQVASALIRDMDDPDVLRATKGGLVRNHVTLMINEMNRKLPELIDDYNAWITSDALLCLSQQGAEDRRALMDEAKISEDPYLLIIALACMNNAKQMRVVLALESQADSLGGLL